MNCETRKRGKLCGREECKPCFSRSFASCEMSKYMVEGQGNPLLIAKNGHKKLEFQCPKCKHSFFGLASNASKGVFCPFCSNKKLCDAEDCKQCFGKSFASHKKAEFWSNDKNIRRPRQVFKISGKKFWFECGICNHPFQALLSNVSKRVRSCAFCAGKKLCDDQECKKCFDKSFAAHKHSGQWLNDKNKKTPREVSMGSGKEFWFKCGLCSHVFESKLSVISSRGRFCPFCSGARICYSENCEMCFRRSFARHKKAKYWLSEKNRHAPREVFAYSHEQFWFECKKKHTFSIGLNSVSSGQWCPKCKHKTEAKLLSFLEQNFERAVHQFKVPWCKNPETNKHLPFDFCVSKTIIELDGNQHYEQVSNWKSPEDTQRMDRYKEDCATKNGYSVLRILQEDVWKDKIDWKKILLEEVKDHNTPVVKRLWDENTR